MLDATWSDVHGPLRTRVAVDNMLDRRYNELIGFPGQRRRVRIEAEATF